MASQDNWILSLISKSFKRKELEFEYDLDFKAKHPSNRLITHSLVTCDGANKKFIPSSVRYTRKSLHFICYSVDLSSDYELMPALSFQPKLSERDRFYELMSSDERFLSFSGYYAMTQLLSQCVY